MSTQFFLTFQVYVVDDLINFNQKTSEKTKRLQWEVRYEEYSVLVARGILINLNQVFSTILDTTFADTTPNVKEKLLGNCTVRTVFLLFPVFLNENEVYVYFEIFWLWCNDFYKHVGYEIISQYSIIKQL